MNLEVELPAFITPLMTKWLAQYKMDVIKDCSEFVLPENDFVLKRNRPYGYSTLPDYNHNPVVLTSDDIIKYETFALVSSFNFTIFVLNFCMD